MTNKKQENLVEILHPLLSGKRKQLIPALSNDIQCMSSYDVSDAATTEKHNRAILDELKKSRPSDTLLLPLLKSTFGERRMFIMNEATCVADVLDKHPALSRIAVVS